MSERKDAFNFGDIVCLKVDADEDVGMIVSILKHANNSVQYGVSWSCATTSFHYAVELKTTELKDKEL